MDFYLIVMVGQFGKLSHPRNVLLRETSAFSAPPREVCLLNHRLIFKPCLNAPAAPTITPPDHPFQPSLAEHAVSIS